MTLTVTAALLSFAAVLLALPARPALVAREGRAEGPDRLAAPVSAPAPRPPRLDAGAVAELAERVAALSRAGLPGQRLWAVLAGTTAEVGASAGLDGWGRVDHRVHVEAGLVEGVPVDGGAVDAGRADGLGQVAAVVDRVVALGGRPAQGLRVASGGPGPLAWMALACDVSHFTGAPLAEVLDGIAVSLRAELEAAREREAALAGPRTTATVLAWLPLAGVGLGLLTGADAVSALVTTTAGRMCLALAVAFWVAGRVWMSRLVRRAEHPRRPPAR
jgi:tight adherence protein B